MIPKRFHQYWTDPQRRGGLLPDDVKPNCESWRHLYPDFDYCLWSDETLDDVLCNVGSLDVWSHVEMCRLPAMRADLIRLALVFELGGFWMDLRIKALTRVPDEILEFEGPVVVEHRRPAARLVPEGSLSNSFFGAPPRSDTVLHALQSACANVARRASGDIFEITGPALLDAAVRHTAEPVMVVPNTDFWDVIVDRTRVAYNSQGMHWTHRQRKEDLYW
jgi:mannosyltransferase OCH1-like enzyme